MKLQNASFIQETHYDELTAPTQKSDSSDLLCNVGVLAICDCHTKSLNLPSPSLLRAGNLSHLLGIGNIIPLQCWAGSGDKIMLWIQVSAQETHRLGHFIPFFQSLLGHSIHIGEHAHNCCWCGCLALLGER